MRNLHPAYPILSATIASLTILSPATAAQPEVDTSTAWTVGQQGFVDNKASLTGLRKNIKSGAGRIESIPCFGEIAVPGVVVEGTPAPFTGVISENHQETANASIYGGTYQARYGTQTVNVQLVTELFRDGKFKISVTADLPDVRLSVPVFMNYDFHGPAHDVFEFAWNVGSSSTNGAGKVPDPLQGQSLMTYKTDSSSIDTLDYFATVPNGVAVVYSGLYQGSNPASIEYTALARMYDAYAKLGVVLWPWSDSGVATTKYTLVFQRQDDGARINPAANTKEILQTTVSYVTKLPSYVVDSASDQAVTVVLEGTGGAGNPLQLAGKLFQKSDRRELRVNVHTWGNLFPWVPEGQPQPPEIMFDPDREVTALDGTISTFRHVLANLVGDPSLLTINVDRVDPTVVDDFHTALSVIRDFSPISQENTEQWQTDLLIFPGNTYQQGIMVDNLGGTNSIEREGAELHWDCIRADAAKGNKDEAWQIDRLTFGGLHELGHTFGFVHEWATYVDPNGGQFTDLMNPSPDHLLAGNRLLFGDKSRNWFRAMPEGWTKPGRYGTWFLPGYPDPDDKTSIDPLYTPVVLAQPQLGDVDFDGSTTIIDALKIARATTGLEVGGDYYSALADVNCDGELNIVDALMVARYAANLIPAPSCPAQ